MKKKSNKKLKNQIKIYNKKIDKRKVLQQLINLGLEEIINDFNFMIPKLIRNPNFCPLEGLGLLYEIFFFNFWKNRDDIDISVSHFLGTLIPLRNKIIQLPHRHNQYMNRKDFLLPPKELLKNIIELFGFVSTLLSNQRHFIEDIRISKKVKKGKRIYTLIIDSTTWENFDFQQSQIYESYDKEYPRLRLPLERANEFYIYIARNDYDSLINFALTSKSQIDEIFNDVIRELELIKDHKNNKKYQYWIRIYQFIYHLSHLYYFHSLEKGIIKILRMKYDEIYDLFCRYYSLTQSKPNRGIFKDLFSLISQNWYLSYFPVVTCRENWYIIPSLFISTATMTTENLLKLIYEDAREIGTFLEDKTSKFFRSKKLNIINRDLFNKTIIKLLKEPADVDVPVIISSELYLCQCKSISARNRKTYDTKIRKGRNQIKNAINTIYYNKKFFREKLNIDFDEVKGLIITLNSFPVRISTKGEKINLLTYKELEGMINQLEPKQRLSTLIKQKKIKDRQEWVKKGENDPTKEFDGVKVEFKYVN